MVKRKIKIGIMSRENYQKRTIAIAKGELKPNPNDPQIWFESLESMAQVLSGKNRQLLEQIRQHKPKSLTQLEAISGRKKSNLSRTLKTMSRYGLVELKQAKGMIQPVVKGSDFRVEFSIGA